MKVFSLAAISTAAIFSMVQYCPAPFAAAIGPALGMTAAATAAADGALASVAGGAIAGGIGKAPSRFRRRAAFELPAGVPQYNWDMCQDQLQGAHVTLNGIEPNGIRVDGVPPACMNLATVITGQPSQDGGPVPIPMGSDSLQYNDIDEDHMRELAYSLKAKNII